MLPSQTNIPRQGTIVLHDEVKGIGDIASAQSADPGWFTKSAVSHRSKFESSGELSDIDTAIKCMNQAISLTPAGDSEMPHRLSWLGLLLLSRFNSLGKLPDLEKAIQFTSEAIQLMPDGAPEKPSQLSCLGCLLDRRFGETEEVKDLEKAIEHHNQAIKFAPQGHPDVPGFLNNLGQSLNCRFTYLGGLSDLNQSIDLGSQAISLTAEGDPGMPTRLCNLGASLSDRFRQLDNLADLEKSIELTARAVSLAPQEHPDMAVWLNSLGCCYESRFERLDELKDLEEAIKYMRRATSLTSSDHPDMPMWLNNLGCSLESRFERLGVLADLDEAIECKIRSVTLTPRGHPYMPVRLNNLGHPLITRFEQLGTLADLDQAIEYMGQAVSPTQPNHHHMPAFLNSLGSALDSRFAHSQKIGDLDKAIDVKNQGVSLITHEHPYMPPFLDSLGKSLVVRFKLRYELADLNKGIDMISQAVSLTPPMHPEKPNRLNNLAYSLNHRFEYLAELGDLDKAIDYMHQAYSLTPTAHPSIPEFLYGLGHLYSIRSDLLGMTGDIHQSIDCYQKAADSSVGQPLARFRAAHQWAKLCAKHHTGPALPAYQRAMELLPQLVWLGNTVTNRYNYIIDAGKICGEAAAVAIATNNHETALEWLEEGRSIVWKQMLQLRTPIDDLSAVDPNLAAEIKQVACDLSHASSPKLAQNGLPSSMLSLEQTAQQYRRLVERWESLVGQARSLPGFEAFLRPQKALELVRAARAGPVVMISVHETRCDALVMQPGLNEISHIPLELSYDSVSHSRIQLEHLVRSRNDVSRYPVFEEAKPEDTFEDAMTAIWTHVVKPVIDFLGYPQSPSSGELPHITWCTTGPLSFLPLHAAGDYSSGSLIFNYVVSSYTPTLSALIPPSPSTTFSGLLAVGQKSTLGMPSLPGTEIELARVQEKSQGHAVTRLDGDFATPAAVLAAMQEHSWVHLACHAKQNPVNPMQSAFYLHGGTLDLTSITQTQLKHADLAFLSACQTATGDENLSEEAVHLAAGMLMAGYRTVIATMWAIGDQDAPLIAERVYEHLMEGGMPDARRAAAAVHKATECLREKVGLKAFAKWVPYIHIGI